MAVKTYKYNDKTQLTKHFNVQEWKCKCGKNHEIKIDDKLPILLENLLEKLGAAHGNIYSGYRCPEYDKKVGGSGKGPHTLGMGVDMRFVDSNGKPFKSSKVALTLEDMGHVYGIGYRSGGSSDSSGNTHIDTKPRKWYGDESISHSLSIWQIKKGAYSFYDYLGIKKEEKKLIEPVSRDDNKNQVEVLINDLNLRESANGKVIGLTPKGIYNVLSEVTADGYTWLQIGDKAFIATKEGDWTIRYKIEDEEDVPNGNIDEDIPLNPDDEFIDDTTKEDEVIENDDILDNDNNNNNKNDNSSDDTDINEPVVKLTFWQRIINFFRNLFNR